MIFLDELSSASLEVMSAIYSLLLGHRVGGHKLHQKAIIVAAGNCSTDSAIAQPLPDTLITRMLPVKMKSNAKQWCKWAKNQGNNFNSAIVDFIQKHNDLLCSTIDPQTREELETYPTPRGWGKAMKFMNIHERNSSSQNITDNAGIPTGSKGALIDKTSKTILEACIGKLAAKAFTDYYNESIRLPNAWDIAQSPNSTRIPNNNSSIATLVNNISDYFVTSEDSVRDNLIAYTNRLPKEYRGLFVDVISSKLGKTPSDNKLVNDIKERLDIQTDMGKEYEIEAKEKELETPF